MQTLLIADDEPWVRELMYELLKEQYRVLLAENGRVAWETLTTDEVAVLLLDLRMPEMNGLEVLAQMQQAGLRTVPIVITANKDVDSAVNAMKLGAYDYIVKPFDNEKLTILIKNAIEKHGLLAEVRSLRETVNRNYGYEKLIGASTAMQRVVELLRRVADSESTLLITGESGTGKEVVARAVHCNSRRSEMPFVALDCAAIPDTLIENEFFGHEKGSFTGAVSQMAGKFEMADNGTLFLDEIGNLRLDVQAKLLRVLQEREFTRIGGSRKIRTNTRIICATNVNLEQAIREGSFREDLYYRINVVPLRLPALREREGDVPLLIQYFLDRFNTEMGRSVRIGAQAMRAMLAYHWPGNVRELENLVHRFVAIRESGEVSLADLPEALHSGRIPQDGRLPDSLSLEQLEERYIRQTLEKLGWNISRAARELGVTRKTLHNKLNRYAWPDGRAVRDSEGE